jgi:hypothetical protein
MQRLKSTQAAVIYECPSCLREADGWTGHFANTARVMKPVTQVVSIPHNLRGPSCWEL